MPSLFTLTFWIQERGCLSLGVLSDPRHRDVSSEGPGPQGKRSLSVGVGAGLMTVSAAEFFQMSKMEFRLDSMAHPRLLF